jgi:hypothetical protein
VGCVTVCDTKEVVAILLEVTYTGTLTLPQKWCVFESGVILELTVTRFICFYVPSIDKIFRYLKRPINAGGGLNVSLVVII